MSHGLFRSQPLLVVVTQQSVQEIDRLRANIPLVFGIDEAIPCLAWIAPENFVKVRIQLNVVFFQVGEQFVGPQNLRNLDQLVIVVVSVEEWLLAENLPDSTKQSDQRYAASPSIHPNRPTMLANMQPKLHISKL